jgi:hypothetical protein
MGILKLLFGDLNLTESEPSEADDENLTKQKTETDTEMLGKSDAEDT